MEKCIDCFGAEMNDCKRCMEQMTDFELKERRKEKRLKDMGETEKEKAEQKGGWQYMKKERKNQYLYLRFFGGGISRGNDLWKFRT